MDNDIISSILRKTKKGTFSDITITIIKNDLIPDNTIIVNNKLYNMIVEACDTKEKQ